ncbi:hypothetical protein [Lacticaseibacillus paracasei]
MRPMNWQLMQLLKQRWLLKQHSEPQKLPVDKPKQRLHHLDKLVKRH